MRARHVMTVPVHTVSEETSIFEAARQMLSSGISALPVVGPDGKLVGILSECDLMRRADIGTERMSSWLMRFIQGDYALATDYIRSHARKVRDIMTRDVVIADEDATLGQLAVLMEGHRIKRVPIVRNGKLIGIVSRSNLLQGLLAVEPKPGAERPSDETVRAAVTAALGASWARRWPKNVIVEDGVVHLWGTVESRAERDACRVAAENVPGVRRVEDHLSDLDLPPGL